jgi:hypothetical protein
MGKAAGRGAALGVVLLAGLVRQAMAQDAFHDCMDPGYLDSFVEAPTAGDLTCVELFRFAVETPDGTRQVRGIADAAAGWAVPPTLVAEVERGARLAANAFAYLGRYSVDNITLLIIDDVYSTEELVNHGTGGETLGVALSDRELRPGEGPECLVTIFGLAAGAIDGSMPVTVAHEMFHCVQGATYAGAKYQSYGDGGAWWIEGTAEAFAAVAIPESLRYTDRSGDFDASVEAGYALDRMLHQSVHFFYWLMQERGGIAALMPFQDVMADTGGREAQWAAMRRAMPANDWQAFAEAYADSRIRHPQGGALSSSPPEGTVMALEETGRQTLPLEPFAISLGRAEYGCGVWGNTAAPDAPQMTWKKADAGADGAWDALPEEVDTREGRDTAWRFVTMPVDDSLSEGEVNTERRQGCTPCMGTSAIDACLVGTWVMSGGGPADWMRAQGFPANVATSGDEQMTLRRDGSFSTAAFEVSADLSRNGVTFDGDGRVAPAQGSWSAEAGMLNICAGTGGMHGTLTVTSEDGSTSRLVGAPGGGSMSMRYSCAGGSLTTTLDMPRLPDMVTSYSKIAD